MEAPSGKRKRGSDHGPRNHQHRRRHSQFGGGDQEQALPTPDDTTYRILCSGIKIGSVIGKGGSIIKSLRRETNARIKVLDTIPGVEERVVLIWSTQHDEERRKHKDSAKGSDGKEERENTGSRKSRAPLPEGGAFLCPAQDALFKVHAKIVEDEKNLSDNDDEGGDHEGVPQQGGEIIARLLVPNNQIGCLLGKGGRIIEKMRNETGAQIRISSKDTLPGCALHSDELVQISGDHVVVKRALYDISARIYESPLRDRPQGPAAGVPPPALPPRGPMFSQSNMFPPVNAMYGAGGAPLGAGPPPMSGYGSMDSGTPWPLSSHSHPVYPPPGLPQMERQDEGREEDFSIRILCPNDRIGMVIGKGGNAIRHLRLASFDEKFSTARQKLVCMVSGEFGESMHDVFIAGKPECDVVLVANSKKIFQFSTAALFFLFNLERFVEETKEILSNTDKVRCGKFENGPQSKYAQLCDIVQIHIPSVPHDHGRLQAMVNNPKPCKYCYNTPNPLYQGAEQKKWYLVKYLMENKVNAQQVRTAFKMSLAMAMGAFLGSWFSRTKGYWADITLGLGFTGASKGSSFKIAALRAQGTVAGSIYGLLVVLATKNFPFLRLVALIPWVVLTSFLRRSKLYGFAGAVSAFTGAIVILARTNKDSSDEAFTVVRIVEAFLGMTCFIIVEMLVMPSRAAAIVKLELISGLGKLKSHTAAVLSVFSESRCEKCCTIAVLDLKVREKSLKSLFARLKELVKEATEEPQFWYAAFPVNVYSKLMDGQTRMMDLLHFSVCAFETILKVFGSADMPVSELHGAFGSAMHVLEERVIPLLEFLEQALQANTAKDVNVKKPVLKSMTRDKKPCDDGQTVVELKNLIKTAGAAHASSNFPCSLSKMGPIKANLFIEEFEKSFHRLLGELVHHCSDDSREPYMEAFSNSLLLSVGALAFSLEGLLREASELEKAVHELLQLESPWSLIDLWDSSSSSFKCREGQ